MRKAYMEENLDNIKKKFVMVCCYNPISHMNFENTKCFCRIFNEIGYDCYIIGFDDTAEKDNTSAYEEWDSIIYGFKARGVRIIKEISKGIKVRNLLQNDATIKTADVVIYNGENIPIFRTLKKISKKNGMKIIVQLNEWHDLRRMFDHSTSISGFFNAICRMIQENYLKRISFVKNRNMLVISKTLEKYYKQRNCRCVRVPNLIENIDKEYEKKSEGNTLVLGYFGDPGRHNTKDLFKNIVKGIALLDPDDKQKIIFRVFGIEKDGVGKTYDIPEEILLLVDDIMEIRGKIDKRKVYEELKKCDFTVLLRENRYSLRCGLPSKMTESLRMGVPMICNLTSDMNEYIYDGVDGIVSNDESPESFARALKKAICLESDVLQRFKNCASEVAMKKFYWNNYVDAITSFINELNDVS